MDLSVVIPVYNAEKTLPLLYTELTQTLAALGCTYEIILVDDGSSDGSFAFLEEIGRQDNRVRIIKMDRNYGQQKALLRGLQLAWGRILLTMDDDLQHPPQEIIKLLAKLQEGYDLVFGIPLEKKHSNFRNKGTRCIDLFFNLTSLKAPEVKISSFRAARREVLPERPEYKPDFVYISALLLQNAQKPVSVTVAHRERKFGRSNYSLFKLGVLLTRIYLTYGLLPMLFSSPKQQREV
ncbi:MAG: glycosyltransferase family 2 protein [Clostridia bacterium]|jgi:undecaprenyl-phosphate 4-deoxy-4-formamido-L-arabinose transferase|nr:glycosyltransferase family 2 protein [Clostridia bacterium]